jgi:hypothetical protein
MYSALKSKYGGAETQICLLKHCAVVLVAPDKNLSDGSQCFNEQSSILLRDFLILQ